MLTVRMNEPAIEAGLRHPVRAAELAPDLRALVDEGVVRHGTALAFARDAAQTLPPFPGEADLTGWECETSSVHLDDAVPVHVGSSDGEPVISEADQVLMLRHGWALALEVVRLVRAMPEPVAVRCIVSASSTNGTFRFHRDRPRESWLARDIDAYRLEKLIVVDSRPPRPGGG
ncbi:hypothetical protein ACQEVB_15410 [Pseudonocardia sp. CA-107938]|uniref:hypothetical protein n=1 Tax=Pseudonocardia sp. CA-107938 TaxID=3240021 RepID=UPI003D91CF98